MRRMIAVLGCTVASLAAMPDVHHVAILSYVVFSFEAQRALGAGVGFRAGFE